MINKKATKKITIFFLVILALLIQSTEAQAKRGRNGRGHRDEYRHSHFSVHHPYPRYGKTVVITTPSFRTVIISGSKYYYDDGIFYRRYSDRYVVIPAPIGAVVSALPYGCSTVIIGGVTYYKNNGIYYRATASGYYEVVPEPRTTISYQTSKEKLGIADILILAQSGVNDDNIIDKIIRTGSVFDLSVEEVETLRKNGVSSRVVNFMLNAR